MSILLIDVTVVSVFMLIDAFCLTLVCLLLLFPCQLFFTYWSRIFWIYLLSPYFSV